MRFMFKYFLGMALIMFALGLMTARADMQIWSTTTGDWFTVDNWTNTTDPGNTRVPTNGDDVVVTNFAALVFLTNSTAWLSSLVISNAYVSCSNWDTTIYVTNLTILKSGVLTCWGPYTNTAMSNRVSLNCANLFIETNGAINVNGKGYAGGSGSVAYAKANGPGGGAVGTIVGACYGGAGIGNSRSVKTNIYGSATAPLDPGSGGTGGSSAGSMGGSGGGAVCITAVQVVVNGTISANGSPTVGSSHCSGGSGGGIYITCATITGTNGAITANAGPPQAASLGGGGGGGRIAVIYDPPAQGALSPAPSIRFSAAPSMSGGQNSYMPGDIGTLYFPDSCLFSPSNLFTGQWLAPGFTNQLSLSEWTVSNVWLRIPGLNLTVTNTFTVAGTNYELCKLEFTNAATINCGQVRVSGATFCAGGYPWYAGGYPYFRESYRIFPASMGESGSTFNCTGDLVLTNSARFYVYAGLTNAGMAADYGARVTVGNEIRIPTNCWIHPVAHYTNGAAVLFSMRNLIVDRYGGINADVFGYAGGVPSGYEATNAAYGPGAPGFSHGAGYGGIGGTGYLGSAVGQTYGSSNAPTAPGSGARASTAATGYGAYGGGSVQIRATETVAIQGMIAANGTNGASANGGGSSGGGIYITCRTFIGDSNGVLQANGAAGNPSPPNGGGGGGGGRIAVWRIFDNSTSLISNTVNGAVGREGTALISTSAPGTIVWGWLTPPNGTIITIY